MIEKIYTCREGYMIQSDFVLVEKAPQSVIEKYKNNIPKQMIELWTQYGFCTMKNGYLRIINPNNYQELLDETYFSEEKAIPLFTTAMGDILVWEDDYLMLLNYRNNFVEVVGGDFDIFIKNLSDETFLNEALDWMPYPVAVQKYGEPAFDECFGYVPLLSLGGPEVAENLQKVKLREHLNLITQFSGPVE
ncbi:DUF1851 domain-containing protein [Fictibacillus enclensis]|uniref:T6SS immunity protein Tdi1 domain-containing protein n=1 Tax=Fictibacillus enclensis TaxID=1017270 RepID=UPI0025A048FE|nr:T6SS immunity protein Tdi1 domain-containing protein [Fictibacillus enclensis]MDM5201096.1 DUF1851 domain-containing protein [Fictibacillus enclensis]